MSFTLPVARAELISTSFPGTSSVTANGPVGLVLNIYYFALALAGFLALGVLVYAGLMRIFQAGSHSGQGEAKKWFAAAGTGLILLLGAYFLLSLVNPSLTVLQFPGLARLAPAAIGIPLPNTSGATGYGCLVNGVAPNGRDIVPVAMYCSATNDCNDLLNRGICGGIDCIRISACQSGTPVMTPLPICGSTDGFCPGGIGTCVKSTTNPGEWECKATTP